MGRYIDTPRRAPRVHDMRARDMEAAERRAFNRAEWEHNGPAPCSNPLPPRRCDGDRNLEVSAGRDGFGNWDTTFVTCPGCPNCRGGAR